MNVSVVLHQEVDRQQTRTKPGKPSKTCRVQRTLPGSNHALPSATPSIAVRPSTTPHRQRPAQPRAAPAAEKEDVTSRTS